jgi:hypothetical protein
MKKMFRTAAGYVPEENWTQVPTSQDKDDPSLMLSMDKTEGSRNFGDLDSIIKKARLVKFHNPEALPHLDFNTLALMDAYRLASWDHFRYDPQNLVPDMHSYLSTGDSEAKDRIHSRATDFVSKFFTRLSDHPESFAWSADKLKGRLWDSFQNDPRFDVGRGLGESHISQGGSYRPVGREILRYLNSSNNTDTAAINAINEYSIGRSRGNEALGNKIYEALKPLNDEDMKVRHRSWVSSAAGRLRNFLAGNWPEKSEAYWANKGDHESNVRPPVSMQDLQNSRRALSCKCDTPFHCGVHDEADIHQQLQDEIEKSGCGCTFDEGHIKLGPSCSQDSHPEYFDHLLMHHFWSQPNPKMKTPNVTDPQQLEWLKQLSKLSNPMSKIPEGATDFLVSYERSNFVPELATQTPSTCSTCTTNKPVSGVVKREVGGRNKILLRLRGQRPHKDDQTVDLGSAMLSRNMYLGASPNAQETTFGSCSKRPTMQERRDFSGLSYSTPGSDIFEGLRPQQ